MKTLMIAVLVMAMMIVGTACGGGAADIFDPGDETAPEITVSGVEEGETYGTFGAGAQIVNISAVAADDSGIANMSMRINGTLVDSANDSTLGFVWNTADYSDGNYEIEVKASDTEGNVATKTVTVTTDNFIAIPPLDLFPDFPEILFPEI